MKLMGLRDIVDAYVASESRRLARQQERAALNVAVWVAAEYGERGASVLPSLELVHRASRLDGWYVHAPPPLTARPPWLP